MLEREIFFLTVRFSPYPPSTGIMASTSYSIEKGGFPRGGLRGRSIGPQYFREFFCPKPFVLFKLRLQVELDDFVNNLHLAVGLEMIN